MKKNFIFSTLIFSCALIIGQTDYAKNVPDSCNPIFCQIFDFQVGDIFQYLEENSSSSGGLYPTTTTTTKYTITNKVENGDTIIYSISGIKKVDYSCDGIYFDPWCESPSESIAFEEQLIYIDSLNHFLNKCDSSIVSDFISEDCQGAFYDKEFYTRILIEPRDNQIVKRIGGRDNLLIQNENDSLVYIDNIQFEEVYSENLGLIFRECSFFEYNSYKSLQGYIRNGDTVGTISTDESLRITSLNSYEQIEMTIFPNPSTGIVFLNKDLTEWNIIRIEIIDVDGNIIINDNVGNDFIDLTFLNEGIFFMKFIFDNKIFTRRIIIRR